jgi:hypothetical protein
MALLVLVGVSLPLTMASEAPVESALDDLGPRLVVMPTESNFNAGDPIAVDVWVRNGDALPLRFDSVEWSGLVYFAS